MARPVAIDTDIGTDIDDTWALAFALRCPELDVRLVTTSTGDSADRAVLVAELLAAGGRQDVPIGVGLPGGDDLAQPLRGVAGREALEAHPAGVHDGVTALVETIDSAPSTLTVIALGPLTTVAAALERRPGIVDRARLVGMHGSLRVGYRSEPGPVPEYNVATDVGAARRVFAAPWECTLTPLDTCGTVALDGERYRRVREAADHDRLLAAVLAQHRAWLDAVGLLEVYERGTTPLYDTVAVHLAYDESLVGIEAIRVSIDDDGTMRAGTGPTLRLARRWTEREAFLDHLTGRLLAPG
ncbi:MAG: nucleoside hydrolase [Actinomycetota bacterium]|nr:nucleoside hydrolase [Actinomycetota bacterium]MDP9020602.1 nucleoside hydrolase [Actinomycetota bacterium]